MSSKPLCIMVDDQVLSLFVQCCQDSELVCGVYPSDERQSSCLLVMLAAAGEFRVLTSAASLERLCSALEEDGIDAQHVEAIARKLTGILEVVPLERIHVEKALRMRHYAAPLALRSQAACAASFHVHAFVAPSAHLMADGEHVMAPTQFFQKVKELYGFDYALVGMADR